MTLKWNFRRGGGVQATKPSVGGEWIFSGTGQSERIQTVQYMNKIIFQNEWRLKANGSRSVLKHLKSG